MLCLRVSESMIQHEQRKRAERKRKLDILVASTVGVLNSFSKFVPEEEKRQKKKKKYYVSGRPEPKGFRDSCWSDAITIWKSTLLQQFKIVIRGITITLCAHRFHDLDVVGQLLGISNHPVTKRERLQYVAAYEKYLECRWQMGGGQTFQSIYMEKLWEHTWSFEFEATYEILLYTSS